MKHDFVQQRRRDLQEYMTSLVRITPVLIHKEFTDFFRPPDRVIIETANPNTLPTQPVVSVSSKSSSLVTSADIERKCQRYVEDVASLFINLSNKSNPLEDEDVTRKRTEYAYLQKTTDQAMWVVKPLLTLAVSSEGLDYQALQWIRAEGAEISRLWMNCAVTETSILTLKEGS
jgi:hypothetical protein